MEVLPESGGISHACGIFDREFIPGEILSLFGEWTPYRSQGRVFTTHSFRVVPPRDPEFLPGYLATIGEISTASASLVVETFGADTLLILSRDPHRLEEVQGLGEEVIAKLTDRWRALRKVDHISEAMESTGLNPEILEQMEYRLPPATNIVEAVTHDPWLIYLFSTTSYTTVKKFVSTTGKLEVGHALEAAIMAACRRAYIRGEARLKIEEALQVASRLIGRKLNQSAQDVDLALNWLESQGLIASSGDHLSLIEARQHAERIEKAIDSLLAEPNELTDQLILEQVSRIIEACSELRGYRKIAGSLHRILSSKVIFVQTESKAEEELFLSCFEAVNQAYPMETVHLSADYHTRPLPGRCDPAAHIGISQIGPARLGKHAPMEAELVIISSCHLVPHDLMAAVLEACPPEANVLFVGRRQADSLFVAGKPVVELCRRMPCESLNLADCEIQLPPAVSQFHRITRGDSSIADEEANFQNPIIFFPSFDDDLATTIKAIAFDDLATELNLSPAQDIQIIVPPPNSQMALKFFEQLSALISSSLAKVAPGYSKRMLTQVLPGRSLPAYLAGPAEIGNDGLPEHLETTSGFHRISKSESNFFVPADVLPLGHAQHVRAEMVIFPILSDQFPTNADLLCAANCAKTWTIVVGAIQNINFMDLRVSDGD